MMRMVDWRPTIHHWLAMLILLVLGVAVGWMASPAWGVMTMAGGLLWLLTLSWPEFALAALVAGFQLYPLVFDMAGLPATPLSSGILFAILTSGALIGVLKQNPQRAWRRITRPGGVAFVVMSLYFLISWMVLTEKTPSALQKMRYTMVIMIPSFLAALWLDEDRIERFAWWVVAFSALGALAGSAKRLLGLIPPDVKRLSLSTTSRSLQFAYSVGLGGLFSWILAWRGTRWRWVWTTFFGSLVYLMVLASGSRGAFLALTVSILFFFVISKQWRRFPMLLLLGGFLLAVVIAPYFVIDQENSTGRLWRSAVQGAALLSPWRGQANETGEASPAEPTLEQLTTRRTDFYSVSWRIIKEHPWLGVGFGGYSFSNDPRQRFLYPHNYLLEVGAETGVVGLTLFCLLLGMAFWRAVHVLRHRPDVAGWIAIAMLIFTLIAGWTSYSITYHAAFWVSLGLVLSLDDKDCSI